MKMKRIFPKLDTRRSGTLFLRDTPETCRDLVWFMERFPLEVKQLDYVRERAAKYDEQIESVRAILENNSPTLAVPLAEPARPYQEQAAALLLASGGLLLADDVGLGKTVSAIAAFTDPRALPALIVTLSHLPPQWNDEIKRFAPHLHIYNPKTTSPGEAIDMNGHWRTRQPPDVIVMGYSKLQWWGSALKGYVKTVVFDECQELRTGTGPAAKPIKRYYGALTATEDTTYRLGLSATPIYNYGGEMFNVVNVLSPDALGTEEEFRREWCISDGGKYKIQDPRAFGNFLRDSGIMLRRTQEEVGRQLPAISRIPHLVDTDPAFLTAIKGRMTELARFIVRGESRAKGDLMRASGEFDMQMRRATGLAKAGYVAEFVKMLVETDRPTVLYGWHHEVYGVWMEALKDLNPVLYTGKETVNKKGEAKRKFVEGESKVMIISLRAGAGLDGLQHRSNTVVFGEFDWSPGVHTQCIGRVARDGQTKPTTAFFLHADEGSDPIMMDVLGIKKEQSDLIRDPNLALSEAMASSGASLKELAKQYLSRRA